MRRTLRLLRLRFAIHLSDVLPTGHAGCRPICPMIFPHARRRPDPRRAFFLPTRMAA
jgi:hypothetical protein